MGYVVPGCVEDGAWMLWKKMSAVAAVTVAHLGPGPTWALGPLGPIGPKYILFREIPNGYFSEKCTIMISPGNA